MGAVDTTYTFTATDTITSTKMNNIIDQTTMTSDAIIGTTLEVASGKLKIRSQGITSNELATGSVTSNAIADGTIVNADINASAAIELSKLATGALPTAITIASANIVDGTIVADDIANATITATKLNGAQSGTAPIFGVRAWAYIDNVVGVFAGGTPTVTKLNANTLCTVTTTAPHGLVTGNHVYVNTAITGITAGFKIITKTSNTEFTFTGSSTGAQTNAFLDLKFANPLGSGNINSVAWDGSSSYRVNLSNEMPNVNYAVLVNNSGYTTTNGVSVSSKQVSSFLLTQTGSTDEIELMVIG